MKKIAFITDSTYSPAPEFAKAHDIFVLPMNLSFGEETYKDGVDITDDLFYEKLTKCITLWKQIMPIRTTKGTN